MFCLFGVCVVVCLGIAVCFVFDYFTDVCWVYGWLGLVVLLWLWVLCFVAFCLGFVVMPVGSGS